MTFACVMVSRGLHGPHGLWVIVGHGFCMTHHDPRGKVANFVFSVCGSCGSLFRPLSIAPAPQHLRYLT